MGLDMYLYLRKKDWKADVQYPAELKKFEYEIAARNFRSVETKEDYQVGYWRKLNAVHNYFVDVCGNGIDECQEIYVSKENALDLIDRCKRVLEDHSKAEELLPTCEGFFFGDTEYDEWYFRGLEYTKELLEKVVEFTEDRDDYDIIYQASW